LCATYTVEFFSLLAHTVPVRRIHTKKTFAVIFVLSSPDSFSVIGTSNYRYCNDLQMWSEGHHKIKGWGICVIQIYKNDQVTRPVILDFNFSVDTCAYEKINVYQLYQVQHILYST
jgi:hypothetical protein